MTTDTNVELRGTLEPDFEHVLTPDAIEFVAALQREFGPTRRELLEARAKRRARLADGETLSFLEETREIREGDWTVAPAPADMQQRWVEITGPTDRKLTINALNSGADGFMADFEDANAPTWRNMVDGHINLRDAIDGTITYDGSDGRHYELVDDPATLLVRPPRLASARAPPAGRLGAGLGLAVRLRHVLLSLRAAAGGQGLGAVLLPAEAGVPPRGAAVERRLYFAQDAAADPARHDQGHGADRDAAGGVRDGRDPLRAARALGGPQRGPLGLHLLGHQVLPRPARDGPARSRRRDDDGAVHARLRRAAGRDLPPARRPRDGRHGRADPLAHRRGGQREGAGGRPRRQGARGRAGLRRHLGRAPRSRAGRPRGIRAGLQRRQQPARAPAPGERQRRGPRRPPGHAGARSPRPGCAPTSASAFSTSPSGSAAAARRRSTR